MKNSSKQLSIFIPTYNRCDLLKDALNSLIHEAYKYNISIIISDINEKNECSNPASSIQ